MEANINDRASVEAAYPEAAFAEDSGGNSRAKATVLRGVRLLEPPDAEGRFALERAGRHVGETAGEAGLPFLAPVLERAAAPGGGADDGAAAATPKTADYPAFIDRLIEAARRFRPRSPPPPSDERLAGPRQ